VVNWANLVSQLFNGLVLGALLALIASGLTIIYGTLGVRNLAHGAMFMLGGYAGWLAFTYTNSFIAAVIAGSVFVMLVGVVMERVIIRYFYNRSHEDQLLVTFGLGIVLVETVRFFFGSLSQAVPPPRVAWTVRMSAAPWRRHGEDATLAAHHHVTSVSCRRGDQRDPLDALLLDQAPHPLGAASGFARPAASQEEPEAPRSGWRQLRWPCPRRPVVCEDRSLARAERGEKVGPAIRVGRGEQVCLPDWPSRPRAVRLAIRSRRAGCGRTFPVDGP